MARWERQERTEGRGRAWSEWHLGPFVVVEENGSRDGIRTTALDCERVFELHRGGKWISDHASLAEAKRAAEEAA